MENFDYSDNQDPQDQKIGKFAGINSRLWSAASSIVDRFDHPRLVDRLAGDPAVTITPEVDTEAQGSESNTTDQIEPHINGTRRMLLSYAHPESLATANPDFNKIIAAISLYDGEGPLDEIVQVSGVSRKKVIVFQTRGIYHIEENENGPFVTSPPLLGVNPEENILFTAYPEPDTSE